MQLRDTQAHVTVLREAPKDDLIHVVVGAVADEHAQDAMDVRLVGEGRAEVRLVDTPTWVSVDLASTHAEHVAKAYEAARAALQG